MYIQAKEVGARSIVGMVNLGTLGRNSRGTQQTTPLLRSESSTSPLIQEVLAIEHITDAPEEKSVELTLPVLQVAEKDNFMPNERASMDKQLYCLLCYDPKTDHMAKRCHLLAR